MPRKLLLADDSITIQKVIELTFADEDVTVTAVGDGQQAIDRMAADRPDIVLADVGMPGKDGYEVAAFIKNAPELAHIPVLLLTGAFEPIDEERARQVKCDGVLAKPFEPQMLIARVKTLLGIAGEVSPGAEPSEAAATPSGPAPAGEFPASADLAGAPVEPSGPPATGDMTLDTGSLAAEAGAAPAADTSLDDYFDRLDAAFAHLAGSRPAGPSADRQWAPPPPAPDWPEGPIGARDDAGEGRTTDSVFGSDEAVRPVPSGPGPAGGASSSPADDLLAAAAVTSVPVADAFASLLHAEREKAQGGVDAGVAPGGAAVLLPGTVVTESFIAEVARRVAEHLGDRALREVASETFSATAERLVREEIERIKASVQ